MDVRVGPQRKLSRKTDAFELWFWKRFLRVPRTARISNQSSVNPKGNQPWIFIGTTDAEAPILWPLDAKSKLIEKDLEAGKDWGQEINRGSRGWAGWMASPTQWTWIWANSWRKTNREAWSAAVHGVTKSQTLLSNWTMTRSTRKSREVDGLGIWFGGEA